MKEITTEEREQCDAIVLISGIKTITLDPTNGTEFVVEAEDLFTGCLDANSGTWKTNIGGEPTGKQEVVIYEQIKNANFWQIYKGFNDDIYTLCCSQGQIIQFFRQRKYEDYLIHENPGDRGYGWFNFLFRIVDKFFHVDVFVDPQGLLHAYIDLFSSSDVRDVEDRYRFVIPQQALVNV